MADNGSNPRNRAALDAYARGDWPTALTLFQQLYCAEPTDRKVALVTALLLARTGDNDSAIALLQDSLADHPSDTAVAARLAALLLKRGDHWRALEALGYLSPAQLSTSTVARTRVECLIETRDFDQAEALLADERMVLQGSERDRLRAKLLERQGDIKALRSHLEAHLFPDAEWHAAALGRVCLALGDLPGALCAFGHVATLHQVRRAEDTRRAGAMILTRQRALHDLDLCLHLAQRLPGFSQHALCAVLERVVAGWPPDTETLRLEGSEMDVALTLATIWHRPLAALPARALSRCIDWSQVHAAVEQDGLAVIDNFLSPLVLSDLRQDLVEGAIWFGDGYAKAYLATDLETGLASPPLLRLIEEVRDRIALASPGQYSSAAWAFKYGAQVQGVDPHADFSRLTLNLWVAPDDANLDPASGGLMFWPVRAPPEASFYEYNGDDVWLERLRSGLPPHRRVAHRCNRAILFDSALLHASDRIAFADRHDARRINLTIAFGYR